MTRFSPLLAAALCTLLLLPFRIWGATVTLDPAEVGNLGISVGEPVSVRQGRSLPAWAVVVVPPHADRIVATQRRGLVTRLHVSVGDRVSAGDLLAEIDSPGLLSLQGDYLDALGNRELASARLQRDTALLEEGIVSRRRFEESRGAARAAAARLAELRQLLRLGGFSDARIEALERTRALRPNLVVAAPADGVVLEQRVRVGDQVGPATPLFRIADLEELWLEVTLPVDALSWVRPGFLATRETGPDAPPVAEITLMAGLVDAATQTATARAVVLPSAAGLRPGQRIRVHLGERATSRGPAWQVPAGALVRHGGETFVFRRLGADFRLIPVDVLDSDGVRATVQGPLSGEPAIVTSGLAALKALWLGTEE